MCTTAPKRIDILDLYVNFVTKPLSCLFQQKTLVSVRIMRPTDDPKEYAIHTILRHLRFLDVDHVFENMIKAANFPPIGRDHIVLDPAINSLHNPAGTSTRTN